MSAVVIQSVYRANNEGEGFKRRKRATPTLAKIFRGGLQKLLYLERKFKYLERQHRSSLTCLTRAHLARLRYREGKKQHMKDWNTMRLHGFFYATVQRQLYYEQKLKYLAEGMIKALPSPCHIPPFPR